jgi:hypothetical protein
MALPFRSPAPCTTSYLPCAPLPPRPPAPTGQPSWRLTWSDLTEPHSPLTVSVASVAAPGTSSAAVPTRFTQ